VGEPLKDKMTSLYDTLADGCAALAAKTNNKSDKARLEQLVEQWRSVEADQYSEAVRRPFAVITPTPTAPGSALASNTRLRKKR
jgi:hypothetical protein